MTIKDIDKMEQKQIDVMLQKLSYEELKELKNEIAKYINEHENITIGNNENSIRITKYIQTRYNIERILAKNKSNFKLDMTFANMANNNKKDRENNGTKNKQQTKELNFPSFLRRNYETLRNNVMETSRLPEGTYVTSSTKTNAQEQAKKNKEKEKKFWKKFILILLLMYYITFDYTVSHEYITKKYDVDWNNYAYPEAAISTGFATAQEEVDKIPDGALLERMIHNLNPINLYKDFKDINEDTYEEEKLENEEDIEEDIVEGKKR